MSFYVSSATFFLLHCDEWDRGVALPRHKNFYFTNMKKIIKHYPMTDRLIVRRGYKKPGITPKLSQQKKYLSHKVFSAVQFSSLYQTANNNNVGQYSITILNTIYILSFIHRLKSHDHVF